MVKLTNVLCCGGGAVGGGTLLNVGNRFGRGKKDGEHFKKKKKEEEEKEKRCWKLQAVSSRSPCKCISSTLLKTWTHNTSDR